MRAFIHSFRGKPWNAECAAAYRGFQKLGIPCILFNSDEVLADRQPEDIVVGGMLIMGHTFSLLGIQPENYNYPDALRPFLHRNIRTVNLHSLHSEPRPVFVKPLEEKLAQGVIVRSDADLHEYINLPPETLLLCSEVLDFVSEWRVFIRYGQMVGMQFYKGYKEILCDLSTIRDALARCKGFPAGYALDFGVTADGRTCLVEMNDGFSIGCYGLNDVVYAKFLYARWAELAGIRDPWAVDLSPAGK